MTPNKTTPGSNKKKGAGPDQRSIMSFFKQPKSIEPKNGKSENKPETIIMLEDDTDGSKPQKIEVKSEVKEEKVETEIKKEPEDKNLDEEFTEKLGEKSRWDIDGLSIARFRMKPGELSFKMILRARQSSIMDIALADNRYVYIPANYCTSKTVNLIPSSKSPWVACVL